MNKILFAAVLTLSAGYCPASEFALNAVAPRALVAQAAASGAFALPEVSRPAPAAAAPKTGRYVQVSGYVSLNGNGWINGAGGFTSVALSGWANFRDAAGQVTSNNTYVTTHASMWIYPNQHVFQTVWPNVYVQFYRGGKPVGGANMTGSVSVSGWPTSSFVSLSGSGYLNGSLYVEDAE